MEPNQQNETSQTPPPAVPPSAQKAGNGVDEHKTLAIVGYIIPILFFLPLMNDEAKHNEFARFHANQQLVLLITFVGLYVLNSMLFMMFFYGGYMLGSILNLVGFAFAVIGIINAYKGEMKELPLIGKFRLL